MEAVSPNGGHISFSLYSIKYNDSLAESGSIGGAAGL